MIFQAPFDLHVPEAKDRSNSTEEICEDIHDSLSITKSGQLALVKALSRYGRVPKFPMRPALRDYRAHCDYVNYGHGEHDEVDQVGHNFAIGDSQNEQQNRQLSEIDADNIVDLICSVPLDNTWDLCRRIREVVGMFSSSAADIEAVEICARYRERLMPTR